MKKYVATGLFALIVWQATSQKIWNEERWQKIIEAPTPANINISSHLYQLARLATIDETEALDRLHRSELRYRKSDDKVNVEIVFRNDENVTKMKDRIEAGYLRELGFNVDQTWRNRASVWIALNEIIEKAKLLSNDYFIFLVTVQRHDDEGPGLLNSSSYKTGTAPAGNGRRVAIFDGGFTDLAGAVTAGKAKTPVYVGIGGSASTVAGVNFAGNQHGTACVETFYDHVPNATFEVYANGNATEKGAAVNDCIAHGVDVISMSQSEYNLGWFDNTGAACQYAQDAADAGIVFITSCGNRANSHYEAVFTDADGDNRHEFSGTDEGNNILGSIAAGDDTHCALSWNTSAGTNFDLYLCRTSDNAVLASSTSSGTGVSGFEYVYWYNGGSATSVYIRVVRVSGPATTFEMFTHNAGNYQFATAAGSNTSPSNTTDLNVISVGAVDLGSYGTAAGGSGIIADYSSQGPTNSGNIAPKLTGPTNTTTRAYSGSFGGTSCATPNLAGAITAFWSANSALDATGVRQIMFRKAQLYKDWGTLGNDNIYGYGGLYLYNWASNLRYMLRNSTNSGVTNATRPFYSLAVAQNLAPTNTTVIILNSGNYSETGLYGVSGTGTGKSILYRSPFTNVTANYGF